MKLKTLRCSCSTLVHDASHIVTQFAHDANLRFAGSHALGGERHGRADIAAWFARLFELFPDIVFTPLPVVVEGWPLATTVATRFRVNATLPNGTPYANEGMQYLRLRFGRILEDRIYEDTAQLEAALATIARPKTVA